MTEENKDPVGTQPEVASGTPEKKEKEVVAYDSYRKAVSEKKSYQDRAAAAEAKLKEYEQQELQAKGKYEELVSSLKEENSRLKNDLTNERKSYYWSKVENAVKTKAVEAGCVNPDKLLRLVDENSLKALEVDDKWNVSDKDLEFLIAEAKKENDFLFKKKSANVVDGVPVDTPNVARQKPVKKLTNEELREQYKASFRH